MVTARYLSDKFLKPRQEKSRGVGREQSREETRQKTCRNSWKEGWTEGWKNGWNEGRMEECRRWISWNQRRLQAETNGQP